MTSGYLDASGLQMPVLQLLGTEEAAYFTPFLPSAAQRGLHHPAHDPAIKIQARLRSIIALEVGTLFWRDSVIDNGCIYINRTT